MNKTNHPLRLPSRAALMDFLHRPFAAFVIFLISLMITGIACYVSNNFANQRIADRFEFDTRTISLSIAKRMEEQEAVLRGGVGIFAAFGTVDREQWHLYARKLGLEKNFPGLLGYGYSVVIQKKDLETHVETLRASGFPHYTVWPQGERDIYTSIIYLEPFAGRNLRAFGYDMFSNPLRRAAMERARDTGMPSMSRKITLVQETGTDVQNGFLLYLPVYRSAAPPRTIAERRAMLIGYVYSPFRMKDLMTGILGGSEKIDFRVYDGDVATPDHLLYDSNPAQAADQPNDRRERAITQRLEIGGSSWTLQFDITPDYAAGSEKNQPLIIAALGFLIDCLIFAIVASLSKQKYRAERTARKMTEDLRISSLLTHAIVETITDGLITFSTTGEIRSANPAAERLFGYASGALTGKDIRALMDEAHHERHANYLARYREDGRENFLGRIRELTGKRLDGSTFPMEILINEFWLDTENTFVATVRDITERKNVDRMKNEFVSVVSHELRTPLTSIRGPLGLIHNGIAGELPAQARDLVRIAHRNSERLSKLVNDILEMEKIASGHLPIKPCSCRVPDLIVQSLEANEFYARDADVTLAIIQPVPDVAISVDPDRFLQIMANLLSNAVKFSPAGAKVDVGAALRDGHVRIVVQDQGSGIAENFESRLFQKFSQADALKVRGKSGTGLGLNISKAITEQMGGTIGFIRPPEGGALFYVEFPIESAEITMIDTSTLDISGAC